MQLRMRNRQLPSRRRPENGFIYEKYDVIKAIWAILQEAEVRIVRMEEGVRTVERSQCCYAAGLLDAAHKVIGCDRRNPHWEMWSDLTDRLTTLAREVA